MENEGNEIDLATLQRRRKTAAFVAGILLSLLLVVTGNYLNPEEFAGFTVGPYRLLFVALFVGISTGHYFGVSLGGIAEVNVAAALGAFLTISAAFIAVTYSSGGVTKLLGPGSVLVISTFLLILGHYSRLIAENQAIERLIEQFAERLSPAVLGIMWLIEAILPPILNPLFVQVGLAELGAAILGAIKLFFALIAFYSAYFVVNTFQQNTFSR